MNVRYSIHLFTYQLIAELKWSGAKSIIAMCNVSENHHSSRVTYSLQCKIKMRNMDRNMDRSLTASLSTDRDSLEALYVCKSASKRCKSEPS